MYIYIYFFISGVLLFKHIRLFSFFRKKKRLADVDTRSHKITSYVNCWPEILVRMMSVRKPGTAIDIHTSFFSVAAECQMTPVCMSYQKKTNFMQIIELSTIIYSLCTHCHPPWSLSTLCHPYPVPMLSGYFYFFLFFTFYLGRSKKNKKNKLFLL